MQTLNDSEALSDLVQMGQEIEQEARRRATEKSLRGGLEQVRKRCKTLAGFIKEAWPILEPSNPYVHGWHIDLICAHLEAITTGLFLKLGLENRLNINVPPGTMKSLLTSVLWPAWEWGPSGLANLRYVATSFSEQNMIRDSRKFRDLVESEWYQTLWPEVVITKSTEKLIENSKRGNRDASRPFGNLTGGRGDRLLIDDPHSTESAESEADRDRAIRIFRESVPLRVNNAKSSAIVLIMQRLHQSDCSGTAQSLGLGYTSIILPMEFEVERAFKSPLGHEYDDPREEEGDLLFPARFPAEVIERDKIPLGSIGVAGQFQQRPTPRGGLMFKRSNFEVIDAAPADCDDCRGWDFAASEKKGAAFSCGVKLGRDQKGIFYVKHIIRVRTTDPEGLVYTTATQDGPAVFIDYPQDPGQAGKVQARSISKRLAGYNFCSTPESGDKEVRARPVAAQAEAGNFKVIRGPWNEAFFAELELFPNSTFKDQIDALSRAFGHFVTGQEAVIVVPVVMTTPAAHFGDNPNA